MAVQNVDCLAQLTILSGNGKRHNLEANHFPVLIGRGEKCGVQLKAKGVWKRHVMLDLGNEGGFVLRPEKDASTLINNESLKSARRLRNGDIITVGSVKLQFWLGRPRQRSMEGRELVFWLMLYVILVAQAWLIWRLG